jgi:uncharacterized C2H2 Zn-finger protein
MMYYNIYNGHTMGNCKMTNSVYRDSNVYQHENKHHLFLHIETIKCLKRKKKRTNKQNQLFNCWSLKYELYSKKTFRWPLNSCKLLLQCQDTLVQFGSFLSMQLSTEEFVKRLPSVDTLIMHYHIPADAAFFLCRTQYAYAINVRQCMTF